MNSADNAGRTFSWTPALIAGAAGGVLSGVPFANCLCCLWIVGAGILAAYLTCRASTPPPPAEGAKVGAASGLVAAAVVTLLSLPLADLNAAFFRRFMERMAQYVDKMPDGWQQLFARDAGDVSPFWILVNFAVNAVVFAGLAALGGIIGMTVFGKRPAAPVPPPADPGSPS